MPKPTRETLPGNDGESVGIVARKGITLDHTYFQWQKLLFPIIIVSGVHVKLDNPVGTFSQFVDF